MEKPHLLLLTHRIPYPPDKGDKIRSWNMLKHLCKTWSVHLGCFIDDPNDLQHREFLSTMTASSHFVSINPKINKLKSLIGLITADPLSLAFYRSWSMKNYVSKVILENDIKTKIAFSSGVAPFLLNQRDSNHVPVVIDFCDSDAEKWRAYAQQVKGLSQWIYAREAKRLALYESQFINQASASFAITTKEAEIFNERGVGDSFVDYWENGVDTQYFNPETDYKPERIHKSGNRFCEKDARKNNKPELVSDSKTYKRALETADHADVIFVGAMDYLPNIEGVEWFCEKVWPKVREHYSELTFAIVGSKPTQRVQKLSQVSGVRVTGRVDDVRPWLAQSKVVVAPLLVARGIQNKVLEAMAMAKPVVASKEAATGIEATDGAEIFIKSTPEKMANQILDILRAPEQGKQVGMAARERVIADYSWSAKLQRLDKILNQYR